MLITIMQALFCAISLPEARAWCIAAHGKQTYGDRAYSFHLDAVLAILERFNVANSYNRYAAYGHDVLEDTKKKLLDMLLAGFPLRAALLCWLVTDKSGATREERKSRTYPFIALWQEAVILKLADRIANVERGEKVEMYCLEYTQFRVALYNPRHRKARELWAHLDHLMRRTSSVAIAS
jgi:guanosine-3',5'-bis(diphosphate) 3'-pyrophosphohydrolase